MDFIFANAVPKYLSDEEKIKEQINLNNIHQYSKIPRIKVGDYITCCNREYSINPTDFTHNYSRYSWELGKIVKVDSVGLDNHVYYIMSEVNAPRGIYANGIRFATKEEIKEYQREFE